MTAPRTTHDGPRRPLLTAFISYSIDDRAAVAPLMAALRAAQVDVLDFFEDEPLGANVEAWVQDHVADADCVIVVISDNSIGRPWIEREVWLALRLLTDSGVHDPRIVPVSIGPGSGTDGAVRFQPQHFHTREPDGPPIVWSNVNSLMLARDGVDGSVAKFLRWLEPQTILITDPEAAEQVDLFDSAMRLYRTLLPDERERVPESGLIDAIGQSWQPDGQLDPASPYITVLAVHHIGGKAIGLLSCDVHRATGIGFVSFWGLRAAHRSHGRGVGFAQEVIGLVRRAEPKTRAMLFAAEPVEWRVLDAVIKDAGKLWVAAKRGNAAGGDDHQRLADPIDGGPSALAQALAGTSGPRRDKVLEQLRRFRRFALYTNGANYNRALERQGIDLVAFTCRDATAAAVGVPPQRRHPWGLMADYVQPPIRPPVDADNDLHLWLFTLLFDGQTLSAAEAVDWIYDVYLPDFLGQGRFELPGWTGHMVGFRQRWRDRFVAEAEPRHLRLRDWLAPYMLLLTEVKKYWVRQQVIGETSGRWDLQL